MLENDINHHAFDIDYEYYLVPVMTSILSPVFSFEKTKTDLSATSTTAV